MHKEIEIKIEIDEELYLYFSKKIISKQFERTFGYFCENYTNINTGIFPRIKAIEVNNIINLLIGIKVKNNIQNSLNLFMRDEYEIYIENAQKETIESARSIFKFMNYPIEHIFEKERLTLNNINNCKVYMDKLPFGYFIEIEGDEPGIYEATIELGLKDKPQINKAYLGIREDYKKKHNLQGECIFTKQP